MAKDEVIELTGDGLEDIEYNLLVAQFGKEEADRLVGNDVEEDEPFDEEVQEILDTVPPLIEV